MKNNSDSDSQRCEGQLLAVLQLARGIGTQSVPSSAAVPPVFSSAPRTEEQIELQLTPQPPIRPGWLEPPGDFDVNSFLHFHLHAHREYRLHASSSARTNYFFKGVAAVDNYENSFAVN